jgi:transposase
LEIVSYGAMTLNGVIMPAPYGQDLRDRILAASDRGKKTKEISGTFGVSPAWVRRVKQVRREQQRSTRLPMGGARVIKIDLETLRKLVEQQPDATIPELHERLGKNSCSESAVGMALLRLGLSFKKRQSMPPNRTGLTWSKKEPHGSRRNPRLPGAG